MPRTKQPEVRLVALKPLPYNSIRQPGDVFHAAKGYADMFIARKMARLATDADVEKPAAAPRKGRYLRRDMRAAV